MSFTSIPILDLSEASSPETKPAFLAALQSALMEVGFLYIKNVGIPDSLFEEAIAQGKAFFELPLEEKLKMEMKRVPSFLGYSRLSSEVTAGRADQREQVDLSTEHAAPGPGRARYYNLLGPNQWPDEAALPGFRDVFTRYMAAMGPVSMRFTSLVAEAIGLAPTALDDFFERDARDQQHKLKIVRYPDAGELGGGGGGQGVGPHKDSMYTSYLLQASEHEGLQAQNLRGQWVDCPPVAGTLVVAVGQGLEALTGGVCASTTHRVLSPAAGRGARYSIPFFQGVRLDTGFAELEAAALARAVPEEVRERRRRVLLEANGQRLDDVEFTFRSGGAATTLGEATLRNRVKSHPDVGERWYPDILASIRAEQRATGREGASTNAAPGVESLLDGAKVGGN